MRREESQQTVRELRRPVGTHTGIGTLYLVGVPIGHPDDLGRRALRILRAVDVIATEDPAATQRLLRRYRTAAALTSYGPAHIKQKVALLIQELGQGRSVALVSECGSPVVADPGSLLVAAAYRRGIPVRSIPGPSAVTAAITAAGFHGDAGHFYANLPETDAALKRKLTVILKHTEPTVLLVEADRLGTVVSFMVRAAPRRSIALCEDLSLASERVLKGTAGQIARIINTAHPPGTTTIVIGPGPRSVRSKKAAEG